MIYHSAQLRAERKAVNCELLFIVLSLNKAFLLVQSALITYFYGIDIYVQLKVLIIDLQRNQRLGHGWHIVRDFVRASPLQLLLENKTDV